MLQLVFGSMEMALISQNIVCVLMGKRSDDAEAYTVKTDCFPPSHLLVTV